MLQLIIMLVYIVGTSAISVWAAKVQAKKQAKVGDYLVARHNLTVLLIIPFLFSEMIGGSGTIGVAQTGFTTGLSGVWGNWGMSVGCVLFVIFALKFYRLMGERYGAMSVPEAIGLRFDERTRVVSLFITALVFAIFYATQLPAAASIISPMLGWSNTACCWIMSAIFILVTFFGGMKGIVWMNLLHTLIMYVGMGVILIGALGKAGGIQVIREAVPPTYFSLGMPDWGTALAGGLGTGLSYIASATCGNISFGAKSLKVAKRGILLGAFLIMPFALMVAAIGICAKVTMPDIPSTTALFSMANSLGEMYGTIISMAIMAAIWSTAPAMLIITCGTLTRDLYKGIIKKDADDRQQLMFSRICIVGIGIVATYFGSQASSILSHMLGAFQIRSMLGVAVVLALRWPRVTNAAVFWSTLAGGALAAIWHFTGQPFGIAPLWPSLALGVLILIILTFLSGEGKKSADYLRYQSAIEQNENKPSPKSVPQPGI